MIIEFGSHKVDFQPWRPEIGKVFTKTFAFDTETTLIDESHPWITPAFILGAACDGKRGYFVQRQHVADFLQAHNELQIAFHHAPFDLEVLQLVVGNGMDLYALVDANRVWDTMLLHRLFVLGSEGHTARNKGESTLETCVQTYLGLELPKDVVDSSGIPVRTSYSKWLNKQPRDIEPVYLEYLGKDVLATRLVYRELKKRLTSLLEASDEAFGYVSSEWLQQQVKRHGPQTHHIQLKAAIALRQVTANGLHVDPQSLAELKDGLEASHKSLLSKLRKFGYTPGKKGCGTRIQKILEKIERQDHNLPLPRTKTGKIGTSEEALEALRGEPFVDLYLEYAATKKLLSTFVDKMAKGTLHPTFQPLVESGRTSSCGDINAQNLPRDGRVRSCFKPSPGHLFIDADFKTLELATLAHSVETIFDVPSQMGDLINDGVDLHRVVAAKLTGKPESEITKDDRQKAKAINFGKPGGMGANGLIRYAKASYGVDLTDEEAERFEAVWFDLFPEMRKYLEKQRDAGMELAIRLNLTNNSRAEFTGDSRFSSRSQFDEADDQPNMILGLMCIKTLGSTSPVTRDGKDYPPSDLDYFWGRLNELLDELPESVHDAIRNRRPSPDLRNAVCREMEKGAVFTTTGRLRADAGYCQQKNTPFQGLAADGAKLAMWRLHRAGYRIVNFIHDEFLIEILITADAQAAERQICQLMQEGMRDVVPGIQIEVESSISDLWSKSLSAAATQPSVERSRPVEMLK